MSYRERLTVLKYSLQRRRERYIIIYVRKILEGLVPKMLDDWEHWSITVLDGVPSVCLTNYLRFYVMSLFSFKKKMDFYLSTVLDFPCQPGFNNSLDHGDCLRWWTPRGGLVDN